MMPSKLWFVEVLHTDEKGTVEWRPLDNDHGWPTVAVVRGHADELIGALRMARPEAKFRLAEYSRSRKSAE